MQTVRRGSRGPAVRYLQERLGRHGYTVSVDGDFGPGTLAAVKQFQAAQGLKADGIVGPQTWDALLVEARAVPPEDLLAAKKAELLSLISPGDKVARVAIEQLGLKEIPDGSNGGPELAHIVNGYWEHHRVTGISTMPPWCAIFVSWCLKEGLGAASWTDIPFGNWFGGVAQIEKWAKQKGVWRRSNAGQPVLAGEIFTMSRVGSSSDAATSTRAGHTGIVIRDEGQKIITVEGNISNKVWTKERRKTTLNGFVRWWDL